MALGKFAKSVGTVAHASLGVFSHAGQPRPYGFVATRPGRRIGYGTTPALQGLFRRGPAIAVSQVNAMATNVPRGSGF